MNGLLLNSNGSILIETHHRRERSLTGSLSSASLPGALPDSGKHNLKESLSYSPVLRARIGRENGAAGKPAPPRDKAYGYTLTIPYHHTHDFA